MKKSLLKTLFVTSLLSFTAATYAAPPNIIVITADDLGYADTTFTGSRDIPTPHLDRIANEGAFLKQGYVTASLCGPSRAGFITGRYQQRFGSESNPQAEGPPKDVKRISQVLQETGYRTGMVGKWHLGHGKGFLPNDVGFDDFYGMPGWGHFFLPPNEDEAENGDSWMRALSALRPGIGKQIATSGTDNIYHNSEKVPHEGYLTETLSREAVRFIEEKNDQPFFLHLSYNAPHTPMQATEQYLERFIALSDAEHRRTYAAMVAAMDDGIGEVLNTLDRLQIADNTIVVFFSDNGGAAFGDEPAELSRLLFRNGPVDSLFRERFGDSDLRWGRQFETAIGGNGADNGQFRFGKGVLFEGGIRVPLFIRWPARIKPGQQLDVKVSTLDLFPTFLAAAGATEKAPSDLDGVNLLPSLERNDFTGLNERPLFWRWYRDGAVRQGNWKLIISANGGRYLFNLADDPGERNNLFDTHPNQAKELEALWNEWNEELPDPGENPLLSASANFTK